MKRILSVILVVVMVFSFASCAKKASANYKIYDGEGKVLYEFTKEIDDNKTAGVVFEDYFKENNIEYEIADGDMIAKIGDLEQDSENWTVYWAVYVNGEYGTVSLWQQEVKDGDLIELKFEESNW